MKTLISYRIQTVYNNGETEKVWLDTESFDEAKDRYDELNGGMEITVQMLRFENIDKPNPIEKIVYSK